MNWLRELIWKRRQESRNIAHVERPVFDLVDFGNSPGTVLDVGANRGGFAGEVLVRAPLMTVHCFEPNQDVCAEIKSKVERWGERNGQPRAIVNQLGVGSKTETKDLIVTGLHAASSFLPVTEKTKKGWPEANFDEVRRDHVSIVRIDDYLNDNNISEVKLLKLDVQGFELEALRGCGDRMKTIEYILCEVQFQSLYDGAPLWDEIVAYASKFGFTPIVMDGFCFGPNNEPLQADILLQRTTG